MKARDVRRPESPVGIQSVICLFKRNFDVFATKNILSKYAESIKGQGSRRVKIGPVTKNNEIWLYCMCMSSVTENASF